MSSTRSVLSLLLVVSAVFAHPAAHNHSHLEVRAPQVYESCVKPRQIALTFDDGPYDQLRSISDQFTAAGGKATFFWNGRKQLRLSDSRIYNSRRIADIQYVFAAGHQVGSHTWSHIDLAGLSTNQVHDAMYRVEEAFSRILGIRPAFMRPPFGSYNGNVQSVSIARGQSLALWDQDTEDANGASVSFSKGVYNNVANSNLNNALILEHETVDTTPSQLVPYAINLFKSKGYQLVTLAECLGVAPYQIVGVPQQQTSAWTCNGSPGPNSACGGSIACQTGTPPVNTGPSNPSNPVPNQYIHPSANAGKCLAASSNSDGATVTVQDCSTSDAQSWTITGTGSLSVFGNKCLDVPGGATASGTKLQVWTCSSGNGNQQWTTSGNTIQWAGHDQCVDLTEGSVTNGNQMQIWSCTGGPNQQFTRTTGVGSGSGGGGGGGSGKTIRPNASGSTCLSASSNSDGATVVVQPCGNGAENQAWTQNGATLLVYGNKCLDVKDGNTANGAKMQIWTCTPGQGNAAQHFTITAAKTIQWSGQTKCLDLTEGSLATGNQIQTWDCSPNSTPYANQIWNFV
ncbi:Glycoside hydrolase/deacetylase [Mycena indigotica]|uniref:Glycoside hydrolase/deacetylase n=1 Tax=Mycena indigotica TaxID=2126181 RepID=A0A8H6T130_9AGAR|nr:Glycoside hydrolase/deacetylase [Mycena indigotica]KAF7310040.1 Glycoside hydrolase/deacetylase [Mycena indigotica]